MDVTEKGKQVGIEQVSEKVEKPPEGEELSQEPEKVPEFWDKVEKLEMFQCLKCGAFLDKKANECNICGAVFAPKDADEEEEKNLKIFDEQELKAMKKAELKDIAKKMDLSTSGKKAEILERILESQKEKMQGKIEAIKNLENAERN